VVLNGEEKRGSTTRGLPQPAVDVLKQWYEDHADDPYPRSEEIAEMATATGLTKQ
jgi:hypothetical protein